MKNINEKGSSLIEVLAVLGVIGVISLGVMLGISKIHGKIAMERVYRETKDTILKTRQLFANVRPANADDIAGAKLVALGIFSEVDEDGYAISVSGNKIKIELSSMHDEVTFTYNLLGVTSRNCIELMTADWGSDPSSGLAKIQVGEESFFWPGEGGEGRLLPPGMESITDVCTASDSIDLKWEYYF